MKFKDKILALLRKKGMTTVDSLAEELKVSRQYIHRLINSLLLEGFIIKIGNAPIVYYKIQETTHTEKTNISFEKEAFLKEHFLIVTSLGEKLNGLEAMQYWCQNQNLPIEKTIDEYLDTRKKYLNYYDSNHLIDGTEKLRNTKGIGEIGVERLFYLDFYAIERFGKTKLGTLMHYAKQGQNKNLMKEIVTEIVNRISFVIDRLEIDAIVYVPPTISRKVQIMDYLEKNLKLDSPRIEIKKISNQIIVPQKALSKLFERVINAKNTFVIPTQKAYKKILILDDAVGSGATINEIALKLKEKKLADEVIGLAITGSFKGFEVISEL
jgi:biotin operon repressor